MTNYLFLFLPEDHPDFDVFYDIFWEFFGEENPLNVQWIGQRYYFEEPVDGYECITPNSNQEKLWESCNPRPFTLGPYFGSLLKLPHKNFAMSHISRTDEDGTVYDMVMAKEIGTR